MKTRLAVAALILAVITVAATDDNRGDAGDGFRYQGVSFADARDGDYWVMGEIDNQNNEDYKFVTFELTVYDSRNTVIEVDTFIISNFKKRSKRSFKNLIKPGGKKISSYKIDFSSSM